jgi:hypothetical protein
MTLADQVLSPVAESRIEVALDLEVLEGLRAELVERGAFVAALQLQPGDDDARLLRLLAHAAHFPLYFGHNWDAVDDCLFFPPAFGDVKGFVLIVTGAAPDAQGRLEAAVATAAPYWTADGKVARLVVATAVEDG